MAKQVCAINNCHKTEKENLTIAFHKFPITLKTCNLKFISTKFN